MHQSRGDFRFLDHQTKNNLLDELYKMIKALDCVGIVIVINKYELKQSKPNWDVFNTAWLFLLEAYEEFLLENSLRGGRIKVDKSSGAMHKKTGTVLDTVIKNRTKSQKISRITRIEFTDSSGVFGI